MIKKLNKKGNILFIILFIIILFLILFVGFIMAIGSSVIDIVFDEVVPELTNLGMVGDANMTEIANFTITPLNNIIQTFTWMTGILYVMMLVASFAFVVIIRVTGSKWLIGFFILLVLLLVIGSIFMSNIYEDFYDDSGDLGTRLKEHVLLSWLILYSPLIFSIIAFLAGVFIFTGLADKVEL